MFPCSATKVETLVLESLLPLHLGLVREIGREEETRRMEWALYLEINLGPWEITVETESETGLAEAQREGWEWLKCGRE